MLPLLGIVRLSDFRDNSASPEQQKALLKTEADKRGYDIIFVEDVDVSGDYGPFHKKRATADWLNNRESEFSGIICRKLDRVARNAEQTLKLLRWADNRNKVIISVNDGIDTSTSAGKGHASLLAVLAEMELNGIKERAQQSYVYLTRKAKRYPGGQVPFGYMPVCLICENIRLECHCDPRRGWKIVPDPEYKPVVIEMFARLINGESQGEIARWLNDKGVPTSRNAVRIRNGKKPVGKSVWAPAGVRKILTSHAPLGAIDITEIMERDDDTNKVTKRSDRKALRGDDGNLVLRAEPIVDYDSWSTVQAMFTDNPHVNVGKPHVNASPLLQVAFCGECGSALYISTARSAMVSGEVKTYRYYICRNANRKKDNKTVSCTAKRFNADVLETQVVNSVLEYCGNVPHATPEITPAQEYSEALRLAVDAKDNLMEALEAGAFKGRMNAFTERLNAAEAHIAELKDRPSRPASTRWNADGQTVRQYWDSLTEDEQWRYLRKMNVKVSVARKVPRTANKGTESGETWKDIPYMTFREHDGIWYAVDLGTLNELTKLASQN